MTTELGLPRPHPPRRPYDTRSHMHTGPLVIVNPQSLDDSVTRLIYLRLYESRARSFKTTQHPPVSDRRHREVRLIPMLLTHTCTQVHWLSELGFVH